MKVQRTLVDTRLGRAHCVLAGPVDGIPVVLMHQTPRSVDEFSEVIPLLAARMPVIAMDTPGYGCSDKPARQPTVGDYAESAVAVLDFLEIETAHFVGHHTGAAIAIEIAATHPERTGKIVLSGPVFVDRAMRVRLSDIFLQWTVKPDGSHLMEKWNKFAAWIEEPALVQRALVDLLRAGETSEFGHFAVAEYRMDERLPLVTCPALLIFGARDPFRFDGEKGPFSRILAHSEAITLDGGVFLPNEVPEDFAREVVRFLGSEKAKGTNR